MLQYKVDDLDLRATLKAVCLIGCAGIINYIFSKFNNTDDE